MSGKPEEPSSGKIGASPSQRLHVPTDSTEHALVFARRWGDVLDQHCALRMEELGIPKERIGSSDYQHGIPWCAFNPNDSTGGGISTGGRITVDAGALDPERMSHLDVPAPEAWRRARLRDRIDAIIAHEDMEYWVGSHEDAVELAPETELPIGGRPRALLRAIRMGEQSIRGGGSSPSK